MAYSGVFSKVAGAVQQQIGQIVTHDAFSIGNGETTEDMVERIENLAILTVAEDMQIATEIVLACYSNSKKNNL